MPLLGEIGKIKKIFDMLNLSKKIDFGKYKFGVNISWNLYATAWGNSDRVVYKNNIIFCSNPPKQWYINVRQNPCPITF